MVTMSDLISRQAVEEITWEEPSYTDTLNVLTEIRDKVRALPSVTPQPQKGKWVNIDESEKWKCSECGRIMWFSPRLDIKPSDYRFCPDCGTKLEVKV